MRSITCLGFWFVTIAGCSGGEDPRVSGQTSGAGGQSAGAAGTPQASGGATPLPSGGAPGGSAGASGKGGSATAGTGGSSPGGTGGMLAGSGGGAGLAGANGAGRSGASGAGDTGGSPGIAGGAGSPSGGLDPASIILSDNFDAQAAKGGPDAAKWLPYEEEWMKDFAPTIDSSKAHSAPNSVRVKSTNVGIGSFLVPKSGFPTPENRFYVRAWINWEKASSAIMGHSGFLVGATARDNSGTEVRLGISNKGPGDQAMMDLNLIGGEGGEVTRYSNGFTDGGDPSSATGNGFQFKADTWVCLEALFDGKGHEFRVWADNAEIEAMHVTDFRGSPSGQPRTTWAPTYSFLKIGAQDYDANLGNIWYDDVVIAKERVGCP